MMKNNIYVVLLFIVLLTILVTTVFMFYNINKSMTDNETGIGTPNIQKKFDYHFVIIAENTKDPFWTSIKKGVERASEDFNVAVEFNGPDVSNAEEQKKAMDIAIASKVDGIAVYVWDEQQTGELINYAVEQEIPAVTVGTDAKESMRSAFIGVNSYNEGNQLGRMIPAAIGDHGEVVILVSSNPIGRKVNQNLIISGINDVIKNYPDIKITTIEYNNLNVLDLEDTIRNILNSMPELDAIVCTTATETTAVAQRLIDLNKVGHKIIGYGNSPEILRYIDREVIFGAVSADFEQMGYDTVRALVDIKQKGRTSAYFMADLQVITKKNVSQYMGVEGYDNENVGGNEKVME